MEALLLSSPIQLPHDRHNSYPQMELRVALGLQDRAAGSAVEDTTATTPDTNDATEQEGVNTGSGSKPGRGIGIARGNDGGPSKGWLDVLPGLALPPLVLSISQVQLKSLVRLALGPLLPHPPYITTVSVTLLQPPLIHAALGLGVELAAPAEADVEAREGGYVDSISSSRSRCWVIDVMAVPVVGWALRFALQVRSREMDGWTDGFH